MRRNRNNRDNMGNRNLARHAMGIFLPAFLSAVMIFRTLSAEEATVYALEETHTEDCFPESGGITREPGFCREYYENCSDTAADSDEALQSPGGQEDFSGAAYAADPYSDAAPAPIQNDLDFYNDNSDRGNLDTEGYQWDARIEECPDRRYCDLA